MEDSDIWKIIHSYFRDNPQSLVRHHIESYNDFFKNGIHQILKEKNPIRIHSRYDDKTKEFRSECHLYLGGKDGKRIYFGKPVIYDDKRSHYMFPNEARLRNMSYGMTIHYDVEVEFIEYLEDGELPNIIGGERDSSDSDSDDENHGGASTEEQATMYESIKLGGALVKQPRKKPMKKKDGLTPAETARIREATEKSMIGKNIQKHSIMLENIYLGKFPIMLQSDFCILKDVPADARFSMGECRNDIGGYFIIDGKEKSVIPQEKFADNMLYIREMNDDISLYSAEIRSVSENVSKPIRTLSVRITAPTNKFTYKNIVVNIPNVRKPVPLFIVFRALGFVSDKEIIQLCLLDLDKYESMIDLFEPSVHESGGFMTQQSALRFIAILTKGKTNSHALEILSDYFLPHIGETNFIQKAYYLGYIVFRLLKVYKGIDEPTNRDNFKFKRIETVGSLINTLFREYYSIQQNTIRLKFEEKLYYHKGEYEENLPSLITNNYNEIFQELGVDAGFKKAFKGNWGAKPHTKRIGVVQDLNRLSHNAMLSHLRKTNLHLDAGVKLVGPRVLHSSQWGFFDPIDTPDGGNIGLHKHLSISSYISNGMSREPLLEWLREKVKLRFLDECAFIQLDQMTKVFVNGLWAGVVDDPKMCVNTVKLHRRNALLPTYMSVSFDIQQNTIFIYTDAGRLCRPIFYRNEDTGKFSYEEPSIQKRIQNDEFSWNELISGFNEKKKSVQFQTHEMKMYPLNELYDGTGAETNPAKLDRFIKEKAIIDYVDTSESEDMLIALNSEALANKNNKYTHLEIHESFIFGMMSNLIIFPENNPATRNSFSCGQSKQAVSLYHTNHQVRMDKSAVVLVNGQTPLVKSRYLEYINNEENSYGENAIVAIMCYTGYNVEDAILVNEGALKRGLFRTTYYSTYETHEEDTSKEKDGHRTIFENIETAGSVVGQKPGYEYNHLDEYGLIRENTQVHDKMVLIGLTTSSKNSVKVDSSKTPKKGQIGIVDKTFITEGEEGQRIAKVRIREERIPAIGDKMASRAGQKGTIGLVIPECDMPFTRDGLRPDLIINPHAIPSRMTIGQFVECIVGKSAAVYGGFGDCTAFNNKGSKIGVFGQMLSKAGYHSSGNDILYNGMTGEQLETEIFIGPTYYMRLKHMVKDKINFRALGPRTALTKQPVSGRANDGGLRIGEMERDSVVSHGAVNFLTESMMERGDKYYMAVCNVTGMIAVYNPSKNLLMSPMADGPLKFIGSFNGSDMHVEQISRFGRSFSIVCIPYSLKLLIQELQCANIQMRIITEDNISQLENLSFSHNIDLLSKISHPTSNDIIKVTRDKLNVGKNKKSYENPLFGSEETSLQIPNIPIVKPANENLPYYEPTSPDGPPPGLENTGRIYTPSSPDGPPPGITSNSPEYLYSPSSATDEQYQRGEQQITSKSPDYPPSTDSDKYTPGERVLIRGGSSTNAWTIKNIGDEFITIENENPTNPYEDSIKVVDSNEIYPASQFNPYVQQYEQMHPPNHVNDYIGQPPFIPQGAGGGIHISPIIKIVNGNDNSKDGLSTNTNDDIQYNGGNREPIKTTIKPDEIKLKKTEPEPEKTDIVGGGGKKSMFDFTNFLIKKV